MWKTKQKNKKKNMPTTAFRIIHVWSDSREIWHIDALQYTRTLIGRVTDAECLVLGVGSWWVCGTAFPRLETESWIRLRGEDCSFPDFRGCRIIYFVFYWIFVAQTQFFSQYWAARTKLFTSPTLRCRKGTVLLFSLAARHTHNPLVDEDKNILKGNEREN